jgi:hypothetical protein
MGNAMKKLLFIDVIFFFYFVVVLTCCTFFFVAYAITYLGGYETVIGTLVLWAILIPYPFYWYWKKRIMGI